MTRNIPSDKDMTTVSLENLRLTLQQTVAEHGGQLLHPSVIAASQRLDEAVLAAQRRLAQTDHVTSQQDCSTT